MDVNEKIVREWLQVCKNQFTIEDVKFEVPRNYSNIDLMSWDGNRYYDYEVKWRSQYVIPDTEKGKEELFGWINQINNDQRMRKILEITRGEQSVHILVVAKRTFVKTLANKLEGLLKDKEIQVMYFDDIIKELSDAIKSKGKVDSEISQVIRMLRYFELIK